MPTNHKRARILALAGSHMALLVFVLISVFPIWQVVNISLRPGDQLLSTSLEFIPTNATWDNYVRLFTEREFLRWLGNSTVVSLSVTLTGVIFASMAGYGFSRFRFMGRKAGLLSLITTQMFPGTMLLLPMYLMLINLGLINSYLGLVIVYSTTALPFCIWTMKGYYDTIPTSLEEAARIDGCTHMSAFYRVVLPLAAPALVITALFSFMSAWSEYIVAAQILQDADLWTLPIGLKSFESSMSTEWGLYGAASIVVMVPVVILFLALSRWLVSGLTLGSVKG